MRPDQARELWSLIEHEMLGDERLFDEVDRPATAAPPWLDLCAWVAMQPHGLEASRRALERLQQCLKDLVATTGRYVWLDWQEHPYELLPRITALVFAGKGQVTDVPEPPGGCDPEVLNLRDRWVREAASRVQITPLAIAPLDRWQGPALAEPMSRRCSLRVLLVDAAGRGMVARLRLHLVDTHGAALRLVPEPGSALTPLTTVFSRALDDVSQFLRRTLNMPHAGLDDTAIAWDLGPLQQGMTSLHGNSAGAAFGLGALWLLRGTWPRPRRRAWRWAASRPRP